MRRSLAFLTVPAIGCLLVAAPGQAQGVLPASPMPMPPSASDAPPKSGAQPRKAKPVRSDRGSVATDETGAEKPATRRTKAAAPRRSTSEQGVAERIDTRPARGGALQLEDDPRSVTPMMQNGRPGVGMKF